MAVLVHPQSRLINPVTIDLLCDDFIKAGAVFVVGCSSEDPKMMLVDRVSGINGTLNGGANLGGRGLERADGVDDYIRFPYNLSLSSEVIVSCLFTFGPVSTKGALVKLGSATNGIAIGVGSGTYDSAGVMAIALFEAVAWSASTRYFWIQGLHCMSISYAGGSGAIAADLNQTWNSSSTWVVPTTNIYINGYGGRAPACTVHAAAIFNATAKIPGATHADKAINVNSMMKRRFPGIGLAGSGANGTSLVPTLPLGSY